MCEMCAFFKTKYVVPLLFAVIFAAVFFVSAECAVTPATLSAAGGGSFPILYVDTYGGRQVKSREKYVDARFELAGAEGGCKIRGRGNTTWVTREHTKKPYLLKLDDAQPLLGLPAARKWLLIANSADKTLLRNHYGSYLSAAVWNRAGWIPEERFVSVFLNGRYMGVYTIMEKIEAAPGRVELSEGSFLGVFNSRLNKEFNFRTERGAPVSIRMKGCADGEYEAMRRIVQHAEDVIFSDCFRDETDGYASVIDTDSFVDWYLVNEFAKNHDARFQASCWFYYDAPSRKIFMTSPYDFDIAFGNISWHECERPEGLWVCAYRWYQRLFEDEAFAGKVAARWFERRGALEESLAWLSGQARLLKPEAELNDAVWHNIGHRRWPHAPGWRKRRTYDSEVAYMTDFIGRRAAWLDGAFAEIAAGSLADVLAGTAAFRASVSGGTSASEYEDGGTASGETAAGSYADVAAAAAVTAGGGV